MRASSSHRGEEDQTLLEHVSVPHPFPGLQLYQSWGFHPWSPRLTPISALPRMLLPFEWAALLCNPQLGPQRQQGCKFKQFAVHELPMPLMPAPPGGYRSVVLIELFSGMLPGSFIARRLGWKVAAPARSHTAAKGFEAYFEYVVPLAPFLHF